MNGIMLPSDKLLSHIHNRKQTAEISLILILIANAVYSWLGGSVVERRSLTGELSMVCTGLAPDGYMGKPSAVGQSTRSTQPFILSGSINE